jgi:hypothetical protein
MFDKKRYILVLLPTKACQLSFHELLVYSLIVYRSGHGKGTTQQQIMQEFALAKGGCRHGKLRGIAKTVAQLQACGLVEMLGRLLYAKEPPQDWFHYKSNPNLPWYKRISNFPMRMLQREGVHEQLTNLQNAVLWLLHSWQKRITAQGLATQLRCGRRSIYRAVDALQEFGLLDSYWATTISRRHLSFWQDKKEQHLPKKGESQPIVSDCVMELCDWSRHDWSRFNFCGSLDQFFHRLNLSQVKMTFSNYNAKQIVEYWTWAFGKLHSPTRFDYFVHKLWWKVWEAAERETTTHRKQGTFSGPNSLGLLRLKTNAAIKALAEKIKADGWDTLNHWEPDFSLALST